MSICVSQPKICYFLIFFTNLAFKTFLTLIVPLHDLFLLAFRREKWVSSTTSLTQDSGIYIEVHFGSFAA